MLSPEHNALADIIRSRSRKAHYMAASSPGRMGIIRGIAAIAGDYASTLPNAQRDAFLSACGHAAATVRGEYDRAPSFIAHNARTSDPGPLPPETCCVAECDLPRKGARPFCGPHLAQHYANMAKRSVGVDTGGPAWPDTDGDEAARTAWPDTDGDKPPRVEPPGGKLNRDPSLEEFPRDAWRDYKEADGPL